MKAALTRLGGLCLALLASGCGRRPVAAARVGKAGGVGEPAGGAKSLAARGTPAAPAGKARGHCPALAAFKADPEVDADAEWKKVHLGICPELRRAGRARQAGRSLETLDAERCETEAGHGDRGAARLAEPIEEVGVARGEAGGRSGP